MGCEIDIAWLTLLLFGSLGVLLALGLPMAFCTGSLWRWCSSSCSGIRPS